MCNTHNYLNPSLSILKLQETVTTKVNDDIGKVQVLKIVLYHSFQVYGTHISSWNVFYIKYFKFFIDICS